MSSHPCWKDEVHQLSSAWIDGDGDDPASTSAPSTPAMQDPAAEQYLADMLLMDSLLANMSGGAAEMQEARIGRVIHALDDSEAAPRSRTRFLRWSPLLAVAATILIVVAGSWVQLTRESLANDVLLAINEVSSESIDRVYTFEASAAVTGRSFRPAFSCGPTSIHESSSGQRSAGRPTTLCFLNSCRASLCRTIGTSIGRTATVSPLYARFTLPPTASHRIRKRFPSIVFRLLFPV